MQAWAAPDASCCGTGTPKLQLLPQEGPSGSWPEPGPPCSQPPMRVAEPGCCQEAEALKAIHPKEALAGPLSSKLQHSGNSIMAQPHPAAPGSLLLPQRCPQGSPLGPGAGSSQGSRSWERDAKNNRAEPGTRTQRTKARCRKERASALRCPCAQRTGWETLPCHFPSLCAGLSGKEPSCIEAPSPDPQAGPRWLLLPIRMPSMGSTVQRGTSEGPGSSAWQDGG